MTDAVRSTLHEPSGGAGVDDLPGLHAREIDRLVAYIFSSDRALGMVDAEAIAEQSFLELRATWPGTGGYPSHQVHLFATTQRVASTWPRRPRNEVSDPLIDSAPDYWDRSDVTRLTVLQDSLDRLPDIPRRAVLLREMCGFSPAESAQILSVPESAADNARADALRSLVPMIDSGTSTGQARRGPLVPEDFGALCRVLQASDGRVATARSRFAAALAQGVAAGRPGTAPPPSVGAGRLPVRPGSTPPAPVVAPPAPPTAAFRTGILNSPAPQAHTFPAQPPAAPQPPAARQPVAGPSPGAPLASFQALQGRPGYTGSTPTHEAPPHHSQEAPNQAVPAQNYAPPHNYPVSPSPTYSAPAPTYSAPNHSTPAPMSSTPLSSMLDGSPSTSLGSLLDSGSSQPSSLANIGTPIFDAVSAWFSSGGGSAWASLDDADWLEASRRAAAMPTVEGSTAVGLPRRRPGANTVPSAQKAMPRTSMFGPPSGQLDAVAVRSRLGGFQDGLRSARRVHSGGGEPIAAEVEANLFGDPIDAAGHAQASQFEAPSSPAAPRRSSMPPQASGSLRDEQPGPVSLTEPGPARGAQPPGPAQGAQPPAPAPAEPLGPAQGVPPTSQGAPLPARRQSAATTPAEVPEASRSARAGHGSGQRPSETRGFGAFYRDYLPQLLALLMVEGARPALAAEIAQDVMSAAYREWARIDKPRDWTRERALAAWTDRREDGGAEGV